MLGGKKTRHWCSRLVQRDAMLEGDVCGTEDGSSGVLMHNERWRTLLIASESRHHTQSLELEIDRTYSYCKLLALALSMETIKLHRCYSIDYD